MRLFVFAIISFLLSLPMQAQELNCTVRVNHSQIQGTSSSVFDALEKAIADFMNNHTWTDLQYNKEERINCTLTFNLKQYNTTDNHFTGELLFQVSRPVFNSTYNSIIFSRNDTEIGFNYRESEPL